MNSANASTRFEPMAFDHAWFYSDAGQARTNWYRALVQQTKHWILDGGDLTSWMATVSKLREDLLYAGWDAIVQSQVDSEVDLVLLGASARKEDLLQSDLDHAVILHRNLSIEQVKPHLYHFIRTMNDLGFPPCQGYVMGTNPRWIGSPTEWQSRIRHYVSFPTWEHARYLFMMMDGRSVHGLAWDAILDTVLHSVRPSQFICWEMAHLGIHKSVGMGWFGRVKGVTKTPSGSTNFPIKERLVHPIVHALRLLCLQVEDICEVSSLERCARLVEIGMIPSDWKNDLTSALEYGWRMRLLGHIASVQEDLPPHEELDVSNWNEGQLAELKHYLKVAKQLEQLTHRKFPKPR